MTFETELYATLSSDAGVTALVADRIYPAHYEGVPGSAYIVYTPIFHEPLYDLNGAGNARVRLQVDCYSEDVDEAAAIARAVIAAIPQTGAFSRMGHNNQDLGLEEDTRLYRRLIEFTIFHRS